MLTVGIDQSALHNRRQLAQASSQTQESLERLSSGLRIVRASFAPSDLAPSAKLAAHVNELAQAQENTQRAGGVLAAADAALSEIRAQLDAMRASLERVANASGLSAKEIAAEQAAVDEAVLAIDRIAKAASIGNRSLLDGSQGVQTRDINYNRIHDVNIHRARFGDASALTVDVSLVQRATRGEMNTYGAALSADAVVVVRGVQGERTFAFQSGTTISNMVASFNMYSDETGVSADIPEADRIRWLSRDYGDDAFVSVRALSGTMVLWDGDANDRSYGTGSVVNVGGRLFEGDRLDIAVRADSYDFDLRLSPNMAEGVLTRFRMIEGGMQFQTGTGLDPTGRLDLALERMTADALGGGDGAIRDLLSEGDHPLDPDTAGTGLAIVEQAVDQVNTVRSRLAGLLRYGMTATSGAQQTAGQQEADAQAAVTNADFAEETASLARSQLLTEAATRIQSVANSRAQSVLTLLNGLPG